MSAKQPVKSGDNNRPFFREQVLRLAATQYFPALDPGVKELIDSLIRVSRGDRERARQIVERALHNRTCPTPADFEAFASELGPAGMSPNGCEYCEGTGRRYVTKQATDVISGEPYQADCQQNCDCALGKYLTSREKSA